MMKLKPLFWIVVCSFLASVASVFASVPTLYWDDSSAVGGNCSVDNSCPLITYDSELNYTTDTNTNCSADGSCPLIAYDSEISYTTDTNCSVDNSCPLITYDSELDYTTDTNTNCSVDNSCPLIAYESEDLYLLNTGDDGVGTYVFSGGDGNHRTFFGRYSGAYAWTILQAGVSVVADNSLGFQFRGDDDSVIMYLEKTGGQVGIGIQPAAKLHVYETTTEVPALDVTHISGSTWSSSARFSNTAASGNVAGGMIRIGTSQIANGGLVMMNFVDGARELVKVMGDGDVYIYKDVDVIGDVNVGAFLNLGAVADVTISGGGVTVTKSRARVNTEGGAGTDDLVTINGGTNGDILIIESLMDSRVVTLKDNTGNLRLAGDFVMNRVVDKIMVISDGTNWHEISRSDNG